ncbi:MAG TPA: tetraacyldisaccharide 4'-kinase [Pyrinomonadaceae bacterium]|jgi:tetraacyldisaccharide 4'-kinase
MILPKETVMLAPLSALYGALTRARLALYRAGALPVHRIEAPVISVGNLTAGGTGKSPLVAWVARAVAREGLRVCILTRGYGRAHPKSRVIVSDGERILAGPLEGGDEPCMLAEMLLGKAAVISDADRVGSARWAVENLKSEVFILDDGFQHLRIARDLNLVLLDATNPWGGRRLLPRGTLREPRENLSRADCIVITRADQADNIASLRAEIESLSGSRPIFLSHIASQRARPLFAASIREEAEAMIRSQPVAAFCAIGNPQAFFMQLRRRGSILLSHTRAFSDHHVYTQSDVDQLEREAREHGARLLVTTAKDAVKLRALCFELPCLVLEIEIGFDEEDGFLSLIEKAVRQRRQAKV